MPAKALLFVANIRLVSILFVGFTLAIGISRVVLNLKDHVADEKLECFLAMNSREIIRFHFCFFRSSCDG